MCENYWCNCTIKHVGLDALNILIWISWWIDILINMILRGMANFVYLGIILTISPHTRYLSCWPFGLAKKNFKALPYIINVKQVTQGWGKFWPKGHNLNISRGPQDYATHQVPTLLVSLGVYGDFIWINSW